MEAPGSSGAILSNTDWPLENILMAISKLLSYSVEKRLLLLSMILHNLENNWHVLFCTFSLDSNNFSFRMINPNFISVFPHWSTSVPPLLYFSLDYLPYFSLSSASKSRQSHRKSSFNSFSTIIAWDYPLGFVSLPEESCAVSWMRDTVS